MKRHAILIAALLLPIGLWAQNLNPEVQVTNEYVTRISDAEKLGLNMTVPDSVLRFDYHFDYSVFESPYKGAYEFSPYEVSITPSLYGYDGRKFYLRTGAGWVLKPELDLVWSVLDRKREAVNVFTSGRGFYGNYMRVVEDTFLSDRGTLDRGWDFGAVAGVDTRFNLGGSVLRAELAYEGIFTGHKILQNCVGHAPYASLRIGRDNPGGFSYTVGAKYRYVNDNFDGWAPLEDHDVKADVSISPYLGGTARAGFDINFAYNKWYLGVEARPHMLFRTGKFDFDTGLRVGWYGKDDSNFTIAPDVKMAWHLLGGCLDLYAGAVGQNYMMSYWDYKTVAHRYYLSYADPRPVREIADLYLGVRGFTGFGLRGDLKAGYRFLKDVPLWAVSATGGETLLFCDCGVFHADLAFAWSSRRIDLKGAVHYNRIPEGVGDRVFAPADVRADLQFTYNWMKRIYAGISGDFVSVRTAWVNGVAVDMPWYVDLGVKAEYKFNNRFGVWLKGSNLLNQDIRLSPLYCQYGPSVIAGITLSL